VRRTVAAFTNGAFAAVNKRAQEERAQSRRHSRRQLQQNLADDCLNFFGVSDDY